MGIGIGMAVPAIRRIVIVAEPDADRAQPRPPARRRRRRLRRRTGRRRRCSSGRFGIPAPFLVIAGGDGRSPCPSSCAAPRGRRDAERRPQRFAFDLLRHPPVRRRRADRVRGVADDRHVRRAVGGRPRRPRHHRVDRQPRHHAVRRAAGDLRRRRWAAGPAGRSVPRRHASGCCSAPLFMIAVRPGADGRRDVRGGDGPRGQRRVHGVEHRRRRRDGRAGERQAGAQGVLGGFQTLVAGVTALVAGAALRTRRANHGLRRQRRDDAGAAWRSACDASPASGPGCLAVESTGSRRPAGGDGESPTRGRRRDATPAGSPVRRAAAEVLDDLDRSDQRVRRCRRLLSDRSLLGDWHAAEDARPRRRSKKSGS